MRSGIILMQDPDVFQMRSLSGDVFTQLFENGQPVFFIYRCFVWDLMLVQHALTIEKRYELYFYGGVLRRR